MRRLGLVRAYRKMSQKGAFVKANTFARLEMPLQAVGASVCSACAMLPNTGVES